MGTLLGMAAVACGYLVGLFTWIPWFIVILFGLPITAKLEKQGLLILGNTVAQTYKKSLLVLPSLFLIVTAAVYFFFSEYIIHFLLGAGIAVVEMVIFKRSSLRANENNISDYVTNNKDSFSVDVERAIACIEEKNS